MNKNVYRAGSVFYCCQLPLFVRPAHANAYTRGYKYAQTGIEWSLCNAIVIIAITNAFVVLTMNIVHIIWYGYLGHLSLCL